MKRREFKGCALCHRGVMKGNAMVFYRFKVDYLAINLAAVQRAAGLEAVLGSPALASVMGLDEDLAKELSSFSGLLCFNCALEGTIAHLHEVQIDHEKAAGPVPVEMSSPGDMSPGQPIDEKG